jgi:glycosyltransferase involved in cell wall biosynthesis
MKIGINASFCRKPQTGIGQVSISFLKKLSELEAKKKNGASKHNFVLYLEEDLPRGFRLPKNFQKNIFLPLLYKRDDLIRKVWWEKYLLPRKAKRDSCDIFFSLYQCPITMPKGIKHLMLVHDIIPKLFPDYLNNARKKHYQRLTEEAITNADKIMTVSRRTEKDLIQQLNISADKISTSYISVDEIYRKVSTLELSKKVLKKYKLMPGYILAGGGMEIRKNVEGVVRAYKVLMERNKVAHFFENMPRLAIYGKLMPDLPLAIDVESLVKELNLTQHVSLLGAVPQADLPALFRNAAVFVYPSKYEGFGMPVLEAMSQGTPVIAGKNSSLPEVGMDSILYTHVDDSREIAIVMKKVLGDRQLRQTLSRRGRERAKSFSWDRFTKHFYHIIENG